MRDVNRMNLKVEFRERLAIFGARLKAILGQQGITYDEVGTWVNVTKAQVGNWCSARREIGLHEAAEIANRLGVSLDHMVGLDNSEAESDGEQAKSLAALAGQTTLADRVRFLLDKEGGSKASFARKADIALSTLNDILNGRDPSFSKIVAMSTALSIPLAFLAGTETDDDAISSTDERKAVRILRQVMRLGLTESSKRLRIDEPETNPPTDQPPPIGDEPTPTRRIS